MNTGLLYGSPFLLDLSKKLKLKLLGFIPGIVWFLVVFILLIMPGSDIPSNDFFDLIYFDKWVHIGLFGFLTFFWQYPFSIANRKSIKMMLIIAILVLAYGVAMEFVQKYFTTTRTFDVTDIMADATGVIIAILIFRRNLKK